MVGLILVAALCGGNERPNPRYFDPPLVRIAWFEEKKEGIIVTCPTYRRGRLIPFGWWKTEAHDEHGQLIPLVEHRFPARSTIEVMEVFFRSGYTFKPGIERQWESLYWREFFETHSTEFYRWEKDYRD